MSGAIDNSPDNRMEAAPPDLSGVIADYYWRTNQAAGQREYVRSRDGFVVDRQPLAGGTKMNAGTQARNDEFIGKKFNSLTIRRVAGQHPKSGAVLVDAECDCGKMVLGALRSEITSGRKPVCNGLTCPISRRKREAKRNGGAKPVDRRKSTVRRSTEAPPGKSNAKSLVQRQQSRDELIEAAGTLRRAAVLLLRTAVAEDLVASLRSEANKIDEQIYA